MKTTLRIAISEIVSEAHALSTDAQLNIRWGATIDRKIIERIGKMYRVDHRLLYIFPNKCHAMKTTQSRTVSRRADHSRVEGPTVNFRVFTASLSHR
jgi:hypothetical protein